MKHLTVESKDLLVGDEAADLLTEYAALIAKQGTGDRVELNALSTDGNMAVVTIVLSGGTTILVETTHNNLPDPDNSAAVDYMRQKIKQVTSPPPVKPAEMDSWESEFDEL
jgi:hypothetical protein